MRDVSRLTYDEWVNFVFDHPVQEAFSDRPMDEEPWHFQDEWRYEVSAPERVLEYLGRLFRDPAFLTERFSAAQIDQGFWFIPGPSGFMGLILHQGIAWDKRRTAIHSIADLFELLFAKINLRTACYMWWDSLITYCAWDGRDVISDRVVLREIIAVIARLSANSSEEVQRSCEHGVEHLVAIAEKENDEDLIAMLREHALVG